ncbi:MAG: GGDEF domain-containing protein, partial [Firmicutes bacterium]|nr:GGDEF domain-containing protein [Bacillota bacterium]
LFLFVALFVVMAAGIVLISYLTYKDYERETRASLEQQLSAVAILKVNELSGWHRERLSDAEMLRRTPDLPLLLKSLPADPTAISPTDPLQLYFEGIQEAYGYRSIIFVDTSGVVRIAAPSSAIDEPVDEHISEDIAGVLETGQISCLDFHVHPLAGSRRIYLPLVVPIYEQAAPYHPLGAIILTIDPETYLYPLITSWPLLQKSAETYLIRRENDEVLFLNPLLFQPEAALSLRIPLAETEVLAVQAVLGQSGVAEGIDYRGSMVIGSLHQVTGMHAGTLWFMVSKVDAAELYAPIRERARQTILIIGALLVLSAAGLFTIWRGQLLYFYRSQAEAAQLLRESELRSQALIGAIPDLLFRYNREGVYREAVIKDEALLQTKARNLNRQNALVGKKVTEVLPAPIATKLVAAIEKAIDRGKIQILEYNYPLNDSEHYFEARLAPIGESEVVSIVRDITERKSHEAKLQYISFHDQLTGLYNRRYYENELKRLDSSREHPIAFISADLDGLKLINDTLGHSEGDDYLKTGAELLKSALRTSDILARIGGDEFAVILPNTTLEVGQRMVERIHHKIEEHNRQKTTGPPFSMSIGLAVSEPDKHSLEETYNKADTAMYEDKKQRREK